LVRLSAKALLRWGKNRFKIIKWLIDWVKEWYNLTHEKLKQ
jgi:hypothetical protein